MLDTRFANWPASREQLAVWYATPLGQAVAAATHERLARLLADVHGQRGMQIGGSTPASDLLRLATLGHASFLRGEAGDSLGAEPEFLPIASGSLNALVLCHVLEFRDQPEAILREAERVLTPEGRLVLVVFNPWSLFGLRRLLPHDGVPWSGRFPGILRLHCWCRRAGLVVEVQAGCWRRPPAHGPRLRRGLAWMERGHAALDQCGAVRILRVRKRETRLTPIPLGAWWRRIGALQPARGSAPTRMQRCRPDDAAAAAAHPDRRNHDGVNSRAPAEV